MLKALSSDGVAPGLVPSFSSFFLHSHRSVDRAVMEAGELGTVSCCVSPSSIPMFPLGKQG